MEIIAVDTAAQIAQVRDLFEEYWTSFGFTACFQGFGEEVAGLPGAYAPPGGGLALAAVEGEPAGCAALRRFDTDRCEFKRLYVRPQFRGYGVGRALLEWVIAQASRAGYCEILADTMPVMERALEMYFRAGFERTEPYSPQPTPGAIYIRKKLSAA